MSDYYESTQFDYAPTQVRNRAENKSTGKRFLRNPFFSPFLIMFAWSLSI